MPGDPKNYDDRPQPNPAEEKAAQEVAKEAGNEEYRNDKDGKHDDPQE